jgi:hypothetical protein
MDYVGGKIIELCDKVNGNMRYLDLVFDPNIICTGKNNPMNFV